MNNSRFFKYKISFIWNFLKFTPKIGFRFLKLLFKKKKLGCKDFRLDNYYCVEGTLNQLIWEVENAVFITLSNSSKIFFDSGELIFNVNKAKTQFELSAYGVYRKQKLQTQIRVSVLNNNDLTNVVAKSKHTFVNFNKNVRYPAINLKHMENHSISFQKSLRPKLSMKRKITFQHSQFLNEYSAALFNTSSIEEVQQLKQLIDNNKEVV